MGFPFTNAHTVQWLSASASQGGPAAHNVETPGSDPAEVDLIDPFGVGKNSVFTVPIRSFQLRLLTIVPCGEGDSSNEALTPSLAGQRNLEGRQQLAHRNPQVAV
jgi:hypothetical protein